MSRNISIKEALGMATKTLVSNKLRSSLTMLGIIIGNASVITLVGLGRGAQTLAKNQLSNLGANVLFIVPGNNDTRRRGISFPKNLVLDDALAISNQVPTVKKVAPQISANEIVQSNSKSLNISIAGVTPEFLEVRSFEVDKGRFISKSDISSARSYVVIGPDLKDEFFKDNSSSLGEKIRIKDHTYEIIGILKPKGAVFGSNQDKNAYIPLTTMVNRITGKDPTYGVSLSFISVEAINKNATSAAKFQITNLLRQRHKIIRDDDFAVRSQEDALNIVTNITSGLTFLLAGIGAVSLVVGGIGIMNIMLVSVSESKFDHFGAGHASTSISAALGMAIARDRKGENYKCVAVIGDGALTGGMALEAINHAGHLPNTPLVVVLNDNDMSISPPVGALSSYLNKVRVSPPLQFLSDSVQESVKNIPLIGKDIPEELKNIKGSVRRLSVPKVGAVF